MLISPPRSLQIMGMDMIANTDIGGGVSNRHSVLDDGFAFSNGRDSDLVSERYFFQSGDGEGGIVFHTPAFQLFTLADVLYRDANLVFFGVNDETNHCLNTPTLLVTDVRIL